MASANPGFAYNTDEDRIERQCERVLVFSENPSGGRSLKSNPNPGGSFYTNFRYTPDQGRFVRIT